MPRRSSLLLPSALLLVLVVTSCARPFGPVYEYEEEVYINLDGSATIIVNTSMAALAAFHGLDVPLDPAALIDRDEIRVLYESEQTRVTRVSRPWRRSGRRYIQNRLEASNVRPLPQLAPFAWATYAFGREGEGLRYVQTLERPAVREVGDVGWTGEELVAVRLHVPSRITFHDAPGRTVERGNILTWEQPLARRLAGDPLHVEVAFGAQRILVMTVVLFLTAMATAAATVGGLIWWVVRKGRQRTA
jgi:hypothetical protein